MAEILNAQNQKWLVRDLNNPNITMEMMIKTYGLTTSDFYYYRNKLKEQVEEYKNLASEEEKAFYCLTENGKKLKQIWENIRELIDYKNTYPKSDKIPEVEKEIEDLSIIYAEADAALEELIVPERLNFL